ncbi:LysR substrate-binding domain-containing protein [Vibrio intestinalis]|uniref:LysR substrate-binding domain-containing protein n=1 Tax=Vibrio intestinalis TaxID=2933291 RepID=UPI0021A74C6B|nr:LysR substrate-binding domain-containing protein [Vibrio intestinalis]
MKKLAPLNHLYSFVAVAETGSMTQAAEQLYVSHSAVSQAIKSLETLLGRTLFQRQGRRVVLNAAGRKYYKQIAPHLEAIVTATQQMQTTQPSQTLTLNMVNSLAMHWWIPQLHRFNQFAPQLDIRLSNLTGQFSMQQEGIDVALIHGDTQDWQDYYCEKLAPDEIVMVCTPAMAKLANSAQELLERYPAIYATNDKRKHDWQLWCEAHEAPLPKATDNLSFSASIQAVQAAIRQLGVLVTHRLFINQDVQQGLLVEVGKPIINPYQSYYFATQSDALKNENILLLRNWLRQEFSANLPAETHSELGNRV